MSTGRCYETYRGHTGSVNCVRFHPTKQLVLTASGDCSVHLWPYSPPTYSSSMTSGDEDTHSDEGARCCNNLITWLLIFRQTRPETLNSYLVANCFYLSTNEDYFCNVDTLERPASLVRSPCHMSAVVACDWLMDGQHFVTASWDRTACLVDSATTQVVQTLSGHDQQLTHVR